MAAGNKWSEDEIILALCLYFILPTKMHDDKNENVQKLAIHLGRTPDAVAMKLQNIKSLDEGVTSKGLTHGGRTEREIWDKYHNSPEILYERIENILDEHEWDDIIDSEKPEYHTNPIITPHSISIPEEEFFQEDTTGNRKYRRKQGLFRGVLLKNYNEHCCLSSINTLDFLVASHIVPWSMDKTSRLDPQNGLILNVFLDKAFDRGYITIDKCSFMVKVAPQKYFGQSSKKSEDNQIARNQLLKYEGQRILLPADPSRRPKKEFLERHNDEIFCRIRFENPDFQS